VSWESFALVFLQCLSHAAEVLRREVEIPLSDCDPFDELSSLIPHIPHRLPDRPAFHPISGK
jgi:hypothetical protein